MKTIIALVTYVTLFCLATLLIAAMVVYSQPSIPTPVEITPGSSDFLALGGIILCIVLLIVIPKPSRNERANS